MPRGAHPNSRANLTRAGGDRYAGKRALIEVIRAALEEHLTDAEIRRWSGIGDERPLAPKHRAAMAAIKASAVYMAILDGWAQGMGEPLYDASGAPAGVRICGLRLGQMPRKLVTVTATDGNGNALEDLGFARYQKIQPASGYYYWQPAGALNAEQQAQYAAAGWEVSADGSAMLGPFAEWQAAPAGTGGYFDWFDMGTVGADDLTRAWFYRDAVNVEHRVVWESDVVVSGLARLKQVPLDTFFFELNGVEV